MSNVPMILYQLGRRVSGFMGRVNVKYRIDRRAATSTQQFWSLSDDGTMLTTSNRRITKPFLAAAKAGTAVLFEVEDPNGDDSRQHRFSHGFDCSDASPSWLMLGTTAHPSMFLP